MYKYFICLKEICSHNLMPQIMILYKSQAKNIPSSEKKCSCIFKSKDERTILLPNDALCFQPFHQSQMLGQFRWVTAFAKNRKRRFLLLLSFHRALFWVQAFSHFCIHFVKIVIPERPFAYIYNTNDIDNHTAERFFSWQNHSSWNILVR